MFKAEHLRKAPKRIKFTVVTISTSRYNAVKSHEELIDESGDTAVRTLSKYGLEFNSRYLVPDNVEEIRKATLKAVYEDSSDIVVLIGGTGISKQDLTIEAISPLFEKRLQGFENLFSLLSYMQVGADSLISRAAAGVIGGAAVFLIPGSIRAVDAALNKLVCPEIKHILHHLYETETTG